MANLKIRSLRKGFDSLEIIKGVDLDINDREFVVFVGPSGCGKSTLLRLIAGLEEVTSGTLELDGRDITEVSPAKRDLAMVFQTYALYPHMSVRKNLSFALDLAKIDKQEVERKVTDAARILELTPLLERKPRQLSGGQRQRVAIGRAIVRQPKIFLFDEPLSNLDAALRVQMRLELARLHQELQATMIYVTHDQVEAMTLAQRVVVMQAGVVEQLGTPVEVYERPATRFVASFIGSPAMNLLDGQVDAAGSHCDVPGGLRLPLGPGYRHLAGRPVCLGIRPEHLQPCSDPEQGLPLVVRTLEILGADNLAHGRWGEQGLVVRLPHQQRPAPGHVLQLRAPQEHLHLFDAASGQRLEPRY